jgi:hypothetical protein
MTGLAVSSLPGSRAVLGWWRDLSGLRPRRLWFAHLLLHRVEVLVEVVVSIPLADLGQALLGLLARSKKSIALSSLAGELHADAGLLAVLLTDLERGGLVQQGNLGWEVAPSATRSDSSGTNPSSRRRERRSFYFVAESPLYLPLAPAAATPLPAPAGWSFDLPVLEACVGKDAEWKTAHGFPGEVVRIVRPAAMPEDWRSVPLARAEQALLVLVETGERGEVVGFSVRADGWTLGREAVLSLPGGAAVLSPLLRDITAEAWKQAWQVWCHQRNLPAGEAEACQLEPAGHRLVVRAPPRLVDRLRAARSDALKGEAWLLAGGGRVRQMALIDLGEGSAG